MTRCSQRPLRIALFTHSTNPRGGVVHTLELGDALSALGHEVVVHAPDPAGTGFFRASRCGAVALPARPVKGGLPDLVRSRIEDYLDYLADPVRRNFDIYHAQDSISGNALAVLAAQGMISGFARTVHHLDEFANPELMAWQTRSVIAANQVFCVSRLWCEVLRQAWGLQAVLIGNGVDTMRFTPLAQDTDRALCEHLGVSGHPVFLAIGGIEARKNPARILPALQEVRTVHPQAQLIIAGGASLLDHQAYHAHFESQLQACGFTTGPGGDVLLTGAVSDAQLAALYRVATALVFPSLKEGFGMVALEAMASGTPVIVSQIPPFTEYLGANDCLWVDPHDPQDLAQAMLAACDQATAARLRQAGLRLSRRFAWQDVVQPLLAAYAQLTPAEEQRAHA